jgi:hypothetical protein
MLQDISDWPAVTAPKLNVACLTVDIISDHESNNNATLLYYMIDRTKLRLAAGDDLIVWSEAAGSRRVLPQEIDWNQSTNPGSVVAVTFIDSVDGKFYNVIELFQAGTRLSRYEKNRHVSIHPKIQKVNVSNATISHKNHMHDMI